MKTEYFIAGLTVIMLALMATAQTSFMGTQVNGVSSEDRSAAKLGGLVFEFQAGQGMVTNGPQLQTWNDLTGNGNNLSQYASTNAPVFTASYTTNGFPAIIFTNNLANQAGLRMNNSSVATLFAGVNKPFTLIALLCTQTNGANVAAVAFGNTSSSNNNADVFLFNPNQATVTTMGSEFAVSSNQATVSRLLTGSTTTNVYHYMGASYDGSTMVVYDNLRISSSTAYTSGYPRQCNNLNVGSWLRNTGVVRPWQGGITSLYGITNAITGTAWTNAVNVLNAQRKVY